MNSSPKRQDSQRTQFSDRNVSLAGAIAMLAGLGIVVIEFRTEFMLGRLGPTARWIVVIAGVFFSVWGLKEMLAGFFPALGQTSIARYRFLLPVEGQIYSLFMLILFVGALIGASNSANTNPLVLMFSMMAGPFIVNGWITFVMLKRLRVERHVPERVMAGDPAVIDVVLHNDKRLLTTWLVSVIDRVANRRELLHPKVQFSVVPPRGSETGHYRVALCQRGEYEFGPIVLTTRFPLGLVERGLSCHAPSRVLVYPRIGRMRRDWFEHHRPQTGMTAQSTPRGGARDDDFRKLREYRPGDDPRAIHWPTSARQSGLMIREYQESRDSELIVLLDAFLPASPTSDDRECLELAISLATSICVDQMRRSNESAPIFAVAARERFQWGGAQSGQTLDPLLDALAVLEADADADITATLESIVPLVTPKHQVMIVSPRGTRAAEAITEWFTKQSQDRARLQSVVHVIHTDGETIERMLEWS